MEFAGKKRSAIVVLQVECDVAVENRSSEHGALGRIRVYLDLD
jgi:hypothetical protein